MSNTRVSEVYIIPTNCEKGYISDILLIIGNYIDTIQYLNEVEYCILKLYGANYISSVAKIMVIIRERLQKSENMVICFDELINRCTYLKNIYKTDTNDSLVLQCHTNRIVRNITNLIDKLQTSKFRNDLFLELKELYI